MKLFQQRKWRVLSVTKNVDSVREEKEGNGKLCAVFLFGSKFKVIYKTRFILRVSWMLQEVLGMDRFLG